MRHFLRLLVVLLCLSAGNAWAQSASTTFPGFLSTNPSSPQPNFTRMLAMTCDRFGLGNCLLPNADGSINVRSMSAPLYTQSTGSGCGGVNAQETFTVTPPAGYYLFLTSLTLSEAADGTGTTPDTLGAWQWKNIGNSTPSAASTFIQSSFVDTANTMQTVYNVTYAAPIRSQLSGSAITISSPAALAHVSFCINATYYFGQL